MGRNGLRLPVTIYLLTSAPAWPQMSSEKAEVAAARRARTCYVEMVDGQLKCGGRPQRSLAAARPLLGPGAFAKADALRLSCWQAGLGLQMARPPEPGADRHRRADREADRVPSVRTQPLKGATINAARR